MQRLRQLIMRDHRRQLVTTTSLQVDSLMALQCPLLLKLSQSGGRWPYQMVTRRVSYRPLPQSRMPASSPTQASKLYHP